jgi:hypothetical protein
MAAGNARADVEHQARVLLALWIEARQVAFVRERRRLPLDALADARVGAKTVARRPESLRRRRDADGQE